MWNLVDFAHFTTLKDIETNFGILWLYNPIYIKWLVYSTVTLSDGEFYGERDFPPFVEAKESPEKTSGSREEGGLGLMHFTWGRWRAASEIPCDRNRMIFMHDFMTLFRSNAFHFEEETRVRKKKR